MIRLVLQTDGTGQDGNNAITNVSRLSDFLINGEEDQFCSYSPGVGTSIGDDLADDVAAVHLETAVNRQYSWLSRCAESLALTQTDDFEVELFGFSRGAFISRLIADLLSRCGIPKRATDATALVNLYEKKAWNEMFAMVSTRPNDFLRTRIGFLGCWDTVVTSLGYDGTEYETVADNVVAAAHAVAINESRPKFNYTKMNLRDGIREEFFAGCHSDVGGGYGLDQVLSRMTLAWMIERAEAAGVLFKAKPDPIENDEYAKAQTHSEHRSKSNGFGALGSITREIDRKRINQDVALLHWDLMAEDGKPLNSEQMIAWVEANQSATRSDGAMIA